MSSIFIITDPEDGKDYDIELSPDELKCMKEDEVFANQKLEEAKHAAATENDEENSSVASLQSNESCSDNVIYKWSHEAILLLIEEYRIRKDDFNSGKISQKKVWDAISKKLIERGHIVTGPQCMSKFAGLKRTYKATKDHNTKSGNNTRSWVYYELMDDLLGHKPFMQPAATMSSTGLAVASSSKRTRSLSESSDSSNQESINITPKTKRSNKQAANTNILLEIQKSRQMSEENREKRHQDKIKQRGEAIEIMRQIASSLTSSQVDPKLTPPPPKNGPVINTKKRIQNQRFVPNSQMVRANNSLISDIESLLVNWLTK